MKFKDKQVLVLGLGDTGLSALRWLKGRGARCIAADTRDAPPGLRSVQTELPEVNVYLGPFRRKVFAQAEYIVASPGIPLSEPEIQAASARGIPVVGDVELFALARPSTAKVIAITGSNGKSTVTTLVGEMCRAAGLNPVVAGNIGLPVLDALSLPTPDVYVLELSSFQLESTSSLKADAAVVLNVTEDHMDRYDDMAAYAAAKARIFHGKGVQLLNRDDHWSIGMKLSGRRVTTFGAGEPAQPEDYGLQLIDGKTWLMQGEQRLLAQDEMRLHGLHNATNALAAIALCRAIGLEMAPLLAALRDFKGLPHRVEWVAEIHGVTFFDDSKGTNVGATCAALSGMAGKAVLIAGGDGKGQDFAPLKEAVGRHARAVVLIGRDAPLIASVLQGIDLPVEHAADMNAAVARGFALAQPGDAVLLSPACASWDMYRNYVHRAEVFVAAVKALEARPCTC